MAKWFVVVAGSCSTVLLLVAFVAKGKKRDEFFQGQTWQRLFLWFVIANFVHGVGREFDSVSFTRLCFVVAGVMYGGIALVLAKHLVQKRPGSLKAEG